MSTPASSPVVQAYLNFAGRCEEAIEFYKTALDAKVDMLLRFKDAPADSQCPGADGNKVMHSSLRIGNSLIMASDCAGGGHPKFEGFSLAISVTSEADADRLFAALSEGGKVEMPLDKTFWSPRFGVVSDKFGVSWMIDTTVPA